MKWITLGGFFILAITGCSNMTSVDVAKNMQPIYDRDREVKLEAIKLLSKINRGGMRIEMKDGKVTAISYTEHLDASVLRQALASPNYNVKSGLQETGEFIGNLSNIIVPLGSLYYGYKINKSHDSVEKARVNADIEITKSNNDMTKEMYKDFTDVTAGQAIEPSYPPEYIINAIKDTNTSE